MRKGRRPIFGLRRKLGLEQLEGCRRFIYKMKEIAILSADHAVTDQSIKVDDFFPIAGTVKKNQYRSIQLPGLLQGQYLGHLV